MQAKTRAILIPLVAIVTLISILAFLHTPAQSSTKTQDNTQESQAQCTEGERIKCTSSEGYSGHAVCEKQTYSKCYIASLDECPIKADQSSNTCCEDKRNDIHYCNDKSSFIPGEYIILKVNLQKAIADANLNIEKYKACSFSKLTPTTSQTPQHYWKDTSFYESGIFCSKEFKASDFHQAAISGIIPGTNGHVVLAEIRVYPAHIILESGKDAIANIENSVSVFKFEVGSDE